MRSFSALIDFLMGLMRDEDARAAFDRDPEGTLASNGLEGVTEQDIRDARLAMAEGGHAHPQPAPGDVSHAKHADPAVREIHHTTTTNNNFDIDIDDRDTAIVDSFNSADTNNVVAIQDNSQTDVDVLNLEDSFNGEPEDDELLVEEPVAEEPIAEQPADESTFEEEPVEEEPLEPDLDPVA